MSDLVKRDARTIVRDMDDLARVSDILAKSGYFADARDAAQAGVKVLAGMEMGIGAFSSMAGIHVIKGKPSIGAGLMAAAVKRSGKYDYRVRKHTSTECVIEFFERGESCGVSEFTMEDAKTAGLTNNDNWKRAPKNMLFARALSNGVRWYAPDVFDVSTYVPEELGAEVDDEGNVVRIEAPAAAPVARALPAKTAPIVLEDQPITATQLKVLLQVFEIARIDVKTPEGKAQAADFLSFLLGEPVETMKGMTENQAGAILAGVTRDDGSIDEDEVRAVMLELAVADA